MSARTIMAAAITYVWTLTTGTAVCVVSVTIWWLWNSTTAKVSFTPSVISEYGEREGVKRFVPSLFLLSFYLTSLQFIQDALF